MDFNLSPEIEDFRRRIRAFVAEHIVPLESRPGAFDEGENIADDALSELRAKARRAGLWALAMPKARGGQGLGVVGLAACYEEMNRSIFGPVAFNAAAPDDGNMIVLDKVLDEGAKDRWLQPIIDGKVRSAFAMSEPAPGAGSVMAKAERTRPSMIGCSQRSFCASPSTLSSTIMLPSSGAAALNATGPKIERLISSSQAARPTTPSP